MRELNSITCGCLARGRTSQREGGLSPVKIFKGPTFDGLSLARIRSAAEPFPQFLRSHGRGIKCLRLWWWLRSRISLPSCRQFGEFKGEISGDGGCRYLRNVFALRYIPRDDPVIIMSVVVVGMASIGYTVVNPSISFVGIRPSSENVSVSYLNIFYLFSWLFLTLNFNTLCQQI